MLSSNKTFKFLQWTTPINRWWWSQCLRRFLSWLVWSLNHYNGVRTRFIFPLPSHYSLFAFSQIACKWGQTSQRCWQTVLAVRPSALVHNAGQRGQRPIYTRLWWNFWHLPVIAYDLCCVTNFCQTTITRTSWREQTRELCRYSSHSLPNRRQVVFLI